MILYPPPSPPRFPFLLSGNGAGSSSTKDESQMSSLPTEKEKRDIVLFVKKENEKNKNGFMRVMVCPDCGWFLMGHKVSTSFTEPPEAVHYESCACCGFNLQQKSIEEKNEKN